VEVFGTFNDPGVDATDNYYPNVTIQTTSTLNMNVLGVYTITYNVCDAANNCVTLTRTVRVVDKTAPVIVLLGGNPIKWPRYQPFTDPGATVNDNYYSPSSFTITVDASKVIHHKPGYYYVTYNTTDGSGNAAKEVKRLVEVLDVTTSVQNLIGNKLNIYPNPVTDGIIRISSEKALLKGVTILDLLGRNVFESILNPSSDIELDVQTLS
ncbi:MAG: immunoglobulin-like domain-containing protein, partial [Bacteroidota bacterium]